jgi:hypothetical protein
MLGVAIVITPPGPRKTYLRHCSLFSRFVVFNCLTESFRLAKIDFNPLNAELIPICHLLALLGAHPILHVSRIRVKTRQTMYV